MGLSMFLWGGGSCSSYAWDAKDPVERLWLCCSWVLCQICSQHCWHIWAGHFSVSMHCWLTRWLKQLSDMTQFMRLWFASNTRLFFLFNRPIFQNYSRLSRSPKVNLGNCCGGPEPFLSPNQQHQSTEGWQVFLTGYTYCQDCSGTLWLLHRLLCCLATRMRLPCDNNSVRNLETAMHAIDRCVCEPGTQLRQYCLQASWSVGHLNKNNICVCVCVWMFFSSNIYVFIQYFDAVDWATEEHPDCRKTTAVIPEVFPLSLCLTWSNSTGWF